MAEIVTQMIVMTEAGRWMPSEIGAAPKHGQSRLHPRDNMKAWMKAKTPKRTPNSAIIFVGDSTAARPIPNSATIAAHAIAKAEAEESAKPFPKNVTTAETSSTFKSAVTTSQHPRS